MNTRQIKSRRRALFRKQAGRCHYCFCVMVQNQGEVNSPTFDHVIPISQGGPNTVSNMVLACWECNTLRSSMPYEQFKAEVWAIKGERRITPGPDLTAASTERKLAYREMKEAERKRRREIAAACMPVAST